MELSHIRPESEYALFLAEVRQCTFAFRRKGDIEVVFALWRSLSYGAIHYEIIARKWSKLPLMLCFWIIGRWRCQRRNRCATPVSL